MGMAIAEKILARHCGKKSVEPGTFIEAKVDIALGNDVTAPLAIEEFKKVGGSKVFDPDRVVLVPDHFTPNKDIKSAEQCQILRSFARKQGLSHYYEVGRVGIEHALLPEEGIVLPGDLVIGADSHTALMEHWELLPVAWARLTWLSPCSLANAGSVSPRQSSSFIKES